MALMQSFYQTINPPAELPLAYEPGNNTLLRHPPQTVSDNIEQDRRCQVEQLSAQIADFNLREEIARQQAYFQSRQ